MRALRQSSPSGKHLRGPPDYSHHMEEGCELVKDRKSAPRILSPQSQVPCLAKSKGTVNMPE